MPDDHARSAGQHHRLSPGLFGPILVLLLGQHGLQHHEQRLLLLVWMLRHERHLPKFSSAGVRSCSLHHRDSSSCSDLTTSSGCGPPCSSPCHCPCNSSCSVPCRVPSGPYCSVASASGPSLVQLERRRAPAAHGVGVVHRLRSAAHLPRSSWFLSLCAGTLLL
jgi:hypothetical protein